MSAIILMCILGSVAPDITTNTFVVILEQKIEIVDLDGNGVPVVFATDVGIGANIQFLDLPVWVQEALVAHELGHIILEHVYEDSKLDRSSFYPTFGTVDPRERDADLEGADLLGTDEIIAMLNYAQWMCVNANAGDCVIETILRAEMLRGQYCI